MSYTGRGSTQSDQGIARTNCPMPNDVHLYHFEILLERCAAPVRVQFGFAAEHCVGRPPGEELGTFGWQVKDGKYFLGTSRASAALAPSASEGDVLGCAIDLVSRQVLFTHNGDVVGASPGIVALGERFYPTVAMHGHGDRVRVVLGPAAQKFDARKWIADEQRKELSDALLTPLPGGLSTRSVADAVVADWLHHAGFAKAAAQMRCAAPQAPRWAGRTGADRSALRQCIQKGDIAEALERLCGLLRDPARPSIERRVYLALVAQWAIELARRKEPELAWASLRLVLPDDALADEERRVLSDAAAVVMHVAGGGSVDAETNGAATTALTAASGHGTEQNGDGKNGDKKNGIDAEGGECKNGGSGTNGTNGATGDATNGAHGPATNDNFPPLAQLTSGARRLALATLVNTALAERLAPREERQSALDRLWAYNVALREVASERRAGEGPSPESEMDNLLG